MAEKRSRGEIRNGKLQKVAADLFLKHGYDGVSLGTGMTAVKIGWPFLKDDHLNAAGFQPA